MPLGTLFDLRFRPGILALLVFQALWLNVIVPGHTRGVVTLPGFEPAYAETSSHGCCAGSSEPDQSDDPQPGDGRAANCAICFFAARLTLPATIDLTPTPLELLETRELPRARTLVSLQPIPAYLGRGPPIA